MALAYRHREQTVCTLTRPPPLQPLYTAMPLVLAPALISDPAKLLRASLLSGSGSGRGGGRGDGGTELGSWLASGLSILQKGPVGVASDATEVTPVPHFNVYPH